MIREVVRMIRAPGVQMILAAVWIVRLFHSRRRGSGCPGGRPDIPVGTDDREVVEMIRLCPGLCCSLRGT